MFSSRTEWNLEENRLTGLVRAHAARGDVVLDLTESNPTRCGFRAPSWVLESLSASANLFYEPDAKGWSEARSAIARYYRSRGVQIPSNALLLTTSTSEAYSFLFRLLCNGGDEILAPRPGYPLFDILSSLYDVKIVPYELRYDGEWHIDVESVRSAVSSRTRAIVVVSPNNPTGSFLKNAERTALENIALETNCAIIADEVFSAFPFEEDTHRTATLADSSSVLTFTLNGISKLAGLPQMKLAWMTVSGPAGERDAALGRLEMISDALLSVSTPIQHSLPLILQEYQVFSAPILQRVINNYTWLRSRLDGSGILSLLNCEGGWNAMVRVPGTKSDEEWAIDLLEKAKVLVHPGHLFDCVIGTYIVISLLPSPAIFREGVEKIAEFFSSH